MITEWSPPDEYDEAGWSGITPMSGLMVALSLIRSLVFLHLKQCFFAHQFAAGWAWSVFTLLYWC